MRIGYLIGGISLPYTAEDGEFLSKARYRMNCAASAAQFHFSIYKKSTDARKVNDIRFVCSVLAQTDSPISEAESAAIEAAGFRRTALSVMPDVKIGEEESGARPLVVGCGPAGMFCALTLAENGYAPILIERGGTVADRVAAGKRLRNNGTLDTETNIQFGAGGAGTFSDGKLTTRINDPLCTAVLKRLREHGAPEDVTVRAKPHIGTDVLRRVVESITQKIVSLGGRVVYNCRLDDLSRNSDGTLTAHTSQGSIHAGCVVAAVGHSARDTYSMLMKKGIEIIPKPFSVGLRVEHLRADIDNALYGSFAGDPRLGAAEYNFSDTTGGRGVYTFCMCPGGEVVAAASEDGGVVVNGMSSRARNGVNSNSAVAVSVERGDFGDTAQGAISFQRNLERAAFTAGGGRYFAPVQTVGDFLDGCHGSEPKRVLPSYMGGERYTVADLNKLLPEFITASVRRGLSAFNRRLPGFSAPDAVLTGVETRTSSPVRITRGASMASDFWDRFYPCGEGAGYAGGITSAAVDGMKTALKIIERFRPYRG